MNQTFQSLIDNYKGKFSEMIIVKKQVFSDETITFLGGSGILAWSSFQKSKFINMKFVRANFESTVFRECIFQSCIFEKTIMADIEYAHCIFQNCEFLNCDFHDAEMLETVFEECNFLGMNFDNSILELCDFRKTTFYNNGNIGSSVLINSKFSSLTKSISFDGEVFFTHVFDQIEKL